MDRSRALPAVVFLVAVLAHVETLGYWFTGTDTIALVESSRAGSVGAAAALFSEPLMAGTRFTGIALFYRPLASLSYAVDYAIWGVNPLGYHITNLLLHGLASALAVALVATLVDDETGAVAGLLVAIHPATVEAIPSAARRHDVLMAVFWFAALLLFVRWRRRRSPWLLAGSLGAFALALFSKEPALLFPGLVGVWAVVDDVDDAGALTVREAARVLGRAVRAVAPYAVVTGAYLWLRVSVLGGLGGYRRPRHLAPEGMVVLGLRYVLSMAYPWDLLSRLGAVVGREGLLALAGGLAVLAAALVGRARRGDRVRDVAGPLSLAVVAAGAGAAALVAALGDPTGFGRPVLDYPAARSLVVGALVVASLAAGALVALAPRSRRPRPDTDRRRAALLFVAWVAAPLALFASSGRYAVRSGYPFLVPAMGLVALGLVPGLRALRSGARSLDGTTALAVVAAVLVCSLAVTSPLFHGYDEWETTGAVNRVTLTGLEAELADEPDGATVVVSGMARSVRTYDASFPRAKSVSHVKAGTVEAWLRLRDPGNEMLILASDLVVLPDRPTNATVRTETRDGKIRAQIDYAT